MRLRSITILAAFAAIPVSLPAAAEGYYGRPYPAYEVGSSRLSYGRGFAQPFIAGEYIGAPLTRVPRPSQIVPTPWSYGTYGVPTVSGIAAPPTGAPTLTVINPGAGRKSGRSGHDAGDVRVVNVSVPRR
ncbi:hypothetical protein [Methylobacterium komagatae]